MPDRRAARLAVFGLVFAVLCATARPTPIGGDGALMCAVARSILARGALDVAPTRVDVTRGANGKHYVKYPLLTAVQCMPVVALDNLGKRLWPEDHGLTGWLAGIPPHVLGGALALGLFELSLLLGASAASAALFAILIMLTTPLWSAARGLYSETLQAFLLVWTLVCWIRARDAQARWPFALGGLLLGLAPNAKVVWLVLPLAVAIDQAQAHWDALRLRHLALAAACALPGLALMLWYNAARYGSVFDQGYAAERDASLGFDVPLWSGLYGLLFSAGKSAFLYAPLLVAAALAAPRFVREHRRDLGLLLVPIAAGFAIAATWWDWSGDWAWGPRLITPVVPLLCLPVLPLLEPPRPARAALGFAALGFALQLCAVLVSPTHHLRTMQGSIDAMLRSSYGREPVRDSLLPVHFVPELSPVVVQPWLVWRRLSNSRWMQDSWYPWQSLGLVMLRPREEPAPPHLDLWLDRGRPLHWVIEALCLTGAFGAAWRLRVSVSSEAAK
jgi:hypothetical protein